jgi:hypothetical protein
MPKGSPERRAILAGLKKVARRGNLYFEDQNGDRTLWTKGVTPGQSEKMILDWEQKFQAWEDRGMKGRPPGPMAEGGIPVFVSDDGTEMMYSGEWEKM